MTLEEAKKVARVCQEADSGCSSCVGVLAEFLNKEFPEFRWRMIVDDDYNVVIEVEGNHAEAK